MVAPDAIFDEVFMAPAEVRREILQETVHSSWSDGDYIDVLIEMATEGQLSARHLGRWLNALDVGFGKFARAQGIAEPELLIVQIGTGSFWVRLRKINTIVGEIIALPGFLLGLYALITQPQSIDEETLRRILAEQRPAATATADLFVKEGVTEIRLSVGERPLGKITRDDAMQFRQRVQYLSNLPPRDDEPSFPAIPTWEAVLTSRLEPQSEPFLLEGGQKSLRLALARPTFKDGTVGGQFFLIDGDPYVRLEGMEGVLVPVKGRSELVSKLENRARYRFVGHYHARNDGLRTAFQMQEAFPL